MAIELHGDRSVFALGHRLLEDPDEPKDPSWGELQIWVAGRNLTSGLTPSGGETSAAQVPLLPVVSWILEAWDHLLHEEKLPRADRSLSAASWRIDSLRRLPSEDEELDALIDAREGWWKRHGLGASLPGFRIPDLHFRRVQDEIELSWDDREWRSVPRGVQLTQAPGMALVDIDRVADPLASWCEAVVAALEDSGQDLEDVRTLLAGLRSPDRTRRRLEIAAGVDIEAAAEQLRSLAGVSDGDVTDTIDTLLETTPLSSLHAPMTTPTLLYRSASPHLSGHDLRDLLELVRHSEVEAEAGIEGRCETVGYECSSAQASTEQGIELALKFRDEHALDIERPLTGTQDLETVVLTDLGVAVRNLHLDDSEVAGAAVYQRGRTPCLAVNESHLPNATSWGRRMTLGHELCHLLFDATRAGVVGVVSNPWAYGLCERRANAFAVTLLAPEPCVRKLLPADAKKRWREEDLRGAMQTLGVGMTTLLWQLRNLGLLTPSGQAYWTEVLSSRC